MNVSDRLSAGLKALPGHASSSFASTQAAWRFYKNESITLSVLQEPLLNAAYRGIAEHCETYALCIHDWSKLSYKHHNKKDTYAVTHETDIGYDLQTSLIVSDQTGCPIAPVAQRLISAEGSFATYSKTVPDQQIKSHLDEVTDCILYLEKQSFCKPLVHMIDREADSIGHIRRWDAEGCTWLVRVKDNPKVDYKNESMSCKTVANQLQFNPSRSVDYHGKTYQQSVAQAQVVVSRPAKPSQKLGKHPPIPGSPISARLIVSRVLDEDGKIIAEWLLLTNVKNISSSIIALWYYWRWKIESFFKLLKSAGHQLESWQQESALAIAKRLLVVSMACVTVWHIAADKSKEAAEFRLFLIKLSGRQMRYGKEFTHPALLAGLWSFLSMLEVLQNYSQDQLHNFKMTAQQFV